MVRTASSIALALAALFVAAPAAAAPTYLTCVFTDGRGDPFPVQLTVDETAATVTAYMPRTGNQQRFDAVFRPESVVFRGRDIGYRLSRVDLTLVRTTPIIRSEDTTVCTIETAPPRAF